jgi:hypothetical protein
LAARATGGGAYPIPKNASKGRFRPKKGASYAESAETFDARNDLVAKRPAHRYPYLRFNQHLTILAARLGAKMGSLSPFL